MKSNFTALVALTIFAFSFPSFNLLASDPVQVGETVSRGDFVIYCTSPQLGADGGFAFEFKDERAHLGWNITMNIDGKSAEIGDGSKSLEAGIYSFTLTNSEGLEYKSDVELTAGISDYQVHFYNLKDDAEHVSEELDFTVFPNPTSDVLYVDDLPQEEEVNLDLVDGQGKAVLTIKKPFAQTSQELILSNIMNGTYTLVVTKENGSSMTKQVVIQR
jgi:hypothetical protein